MNESDFATLLDRVPADLDPDVSGIVTAASGRGRRSLRRRRAGIVVGGVAVLAIAVGVPTALRSGPSAADRTPVAGPSARATPISQPVSPDRRIVVPVERVPEDVGSFLRPDQVGPLLEDPYPSAGDTGQLHAHFRYRGTLTTLDIEPAASAPGSCAALAVGASTCRVVDGLEVLEIRQLTGRYRLTGARVWQHGYTVTLQSTNVADTIATPGTDTPVTDEAPAITVEQATMIASSPHWFEVPGPDGIDTDGDGFADVEVTARPRPIEAVHADIQRILGPAASDVLQGHGPRGVGGPRTTMKGNEMSWFFRFADAEAQVSVSPVGRGCTPSGEQVAHQTGCLRANGVDYRTAGPWSNDGPGALGQTAVAWQHGFEIMLISTNVHEEVEGEDLDRTRVADQPTIPLDRLVELATSDIWFEK